MKHHEAVITSYVQQAMKETSTLAVIVIGSVAQGRERESSDVDLYLVVDDETFNSAFAANNVAWTARHDLDYPGGYLDIKLASPDYLRRATVHADDPTRASLQGARVAFARGMFADELPALLQGVTVIPDAVWDERLRGFIAAARLHGGYFLPQAIERGDSFLAAHASVHAAYAAARAALAANRILLQGPKYVYNAMSELPDLPPGFSDAVLELVKVPSLNAGARLLSMLDEWSPVLLSAEDTLSTYIRDNELAWLSGTAPIEYS